MIINEESLFCNEQLALSEKFNTHLTSLIREVYSRMNKEIVASEFLSKYYRLLWVFRHTEVDACQEGNEFSYLMQVNYLKEFEKIRRPGEDSDWNYCLFSSTFPQ